MVLVIILDVIDYEHRTGLTGISTELTDITALLNYVPVLDRTCPPPCCCRVRVHTPHPRGHTTVYNDWQHASMDVTADAIINYAAACILLIIRGAFMAAAEQ